VTQAIAFLRTQAAGDVHYVIALVAVVGEAHGDAAELQVTQPHRHREDVHLAAGIVHVVLALNPMAGGLQQVRDRGAVGRASAMADMQGAVRIGRDELHLHRLARLGRCVAVAFALLEHATQGAEPARLVEVEIDEAGTGDLDLGQMLRARHRLGERLRQFARLASGELGQQQGHVGGVVAMFAALGAFDDEGGLSFGRQDAGALEVEQRLQHQFAQMIFHGSL
jgi:hypothetical protein